MIDKYTLDHEYLTDSEEKEFIKDDLLTDRDVKIVHAMLKDYADTPQKEEALVVTIIEAKDTKLDYDMQVYLQNRTKKRLDKHIDKINECISEAMTLLNDLKSAAEMSPNNKFVLETLSTLKATGTTKEEIVRDFSSRTKQDLLGYGFSKTRIEEDILPVLKRLIKNNL